MKNLKMKLRDIPTPLAGLALGIASLGWALENTGLFAGHMQQVGAIIATVLLLLILLKFIFHPKLLSQELAHPLLGSILPTSTMALMVISKEVSITLYANIIVWLIAVALHAVFLIAFVYHRIKDFHWEHKIPAWFVPPVGIIVASLTYPDATFHTMAAVILCFGMISYAILLPAMLYRLIFHNPIALAAQPTIAILAAPASLSLAGYLTVVKHPAAIVIAILFGIAILMTITIYVAFFKLLRLNFSAGYAAFTFPMVIGATALFKIVAWMQTTHIPQVYISQVDFLAKFELIIATLIVLYVAVRYIAHYLIKTILVKEVKN
jgi:tellurite resistance protein TehA-like permease